jgi:hypothetical protein
MTRIEAHIFVNRISSNHHYYICGLCGGGGGRNKNTIIRRNMLLLLHTYVYLCISVWRRMRKRRERESSSWILYKIARVMNGFSWESGTSVCVCCALSLSLALSLPLSLSLSLSLSLDGSVCVHGSFGSLQLLLLSGHWTKPTKSSFFIAQVGINIFN